VGALIVSGDEATYDPRVSELARTAGFVLTMAMFQSELTGWSHLVIPGTSYLEREGTIVNLEGRPQRLRRAVIPSFPDELEWLAALGERFGVSIAPWPTGSLPDAQAALPTPSTEGVVVAPALPSEDKSGPNGMRLVRYRALFSGGAVERVPQLQFQRPLAEVELARSDADASGIASGDAVTISSNGTSVELTARVNRRLRAGVARIADEHSRDLADHVSVNPRKGED
jgi:NADH-quinone oxidoreductase subunit G